MAPLLTLLQLAAIWIIAYAMGAGLVKTLVPEDIEAEHGPLIAPAVGYLAFCFVAFTLSASFHVAAVPASWASFGVLLFISAASQARAAWRFRPAQAKAWGGRTLMLILPMAVFTLFPLFYFGAQTYLGAVNPDFFAGLVDDDYLLGGHAVSDYKSTTTDTHYPIEYGAGHLSVSARFGAGLFGILVKLLLGVETRTALTLCIAFFLLLLPLTLHFFCRVVMGLEKSAAGLAAWLIGISAPTAASYIYYYIGQNSGLPALPLTAAAAFLMLMRPGFRTLIFAVLLANAVFVNYFAMLPYALAPAGALGLYLVAKGRLSILKAVVMAVGFLAITLLMKVGDIRNTLDSMRAWMNVIGQTLQGQFFLEFLTELFVPYFSGIYNYPASPWIVQRYGEATRILEAFAGSSVIAAAIAFIVLWTRQAREMAQRVFVIAAVVIYAAVWARYTFLQQYGYAVFKMASWLQFILVPFMAFGTVWALRRIGSVLRPGVATVALAATAVSYIALNAFANAHYAGNGFGRNTVSGYIVNHFGVSGNRDYFEVGPALAKLVDPKQSVGLIFTDSIRNYLTSYYLPGVRQSILSHDTLPGDDENLPDAETNKVTDYYGNVRDAVNGFFHDGTSDDFYLTWGDKDINRDIVASGFHAEPIWQDDSFKLYRAADVHDVLFTGKGFYRLEYFEPKPYIFPSVMRWSADGGEFYLLRPSQPGGAYRLMFDVAVGYEYKNDSRTLEIWLDGRKIEEIVVTDYARVVTKPFAPKAGISKIVVRIKERNKPTPRPLAIWNRDIPADYRRLNAHFSNVRILAPQETVRLPAPPTARTVGFLDFPKYLERFDGLQLDGWIGDRIEMVLNAPAGASILRIGGYLPGNLGFSFPYAMRFRINGEEIERSVPAAGGFALEVPLPKGAEKLDVAIVPGKSVDLGEESFRHKVLRRSFRLESITLQ